MNTPPPGVVDHSGSNLHKPPDDGAYGRLDRLTPERRIPDLVEQVIGEASDKEPCLIRCEAMTTCFVPSQGVLPFFDPVFDLSPAIVCRNYFVCFKGLDTSPPSRCDGYHLIYSHFQIIHDPKST
jgi:hypothetical protein